MTAGFVHLFASANSGWVGSLQMALLRQGLGLRLHTEIRHLLGALSLQGGKPEPSLVLLAGPFNHWCQVARQLRSATPSTPVFAVLSQFTEASVSQAMALGIAVCWPASVRADLLASNLRRLLAVRQAGTGTVWRFNRRGWEIESPHGVAVALTSAERTLLLALCNSPDKRLSHGVLDDIHGAAGEPNGENGEARSFGTRRLSVLMSRLRKKFGAAGLEFPIRSLRGVGYELCVEFEAPAPHEFEG